MDIPAFAPAPAPAPLLECRLCDLSFDTGEEKRQHAKSEWHVYKIRCRVAEPGTTIPPPESGSGPKPSSRRSPPPLADEESYDGDSESDTSSEEAIIKFIPRDCLFCNQTSEDFGKNLSHMHQTHSLVVPSQSLLVVDLQTLIGFLHMVIFSYRECICCGKRRRTVEAVQQHMTSMGHCRFDMTEEMSAFYDMDTLGPGQQIAESFSQTGDRTLRLPSGKLLAHRFRANATSPKSRLREEPKAGPSPALPASQQSPTGPQALIKRDQKEQAIENRLAQLRTGDRMSLVQLPESQQRSLLVARKKELDEAKRVERRKRARVDNMGNKTAIHTNYYKQEVPIYQGG